MVQKRNLTRKRNATPKKRTGNPEDPGKKHENAMSNFIFGKRNSCGRIARGMDLRKELSGGGTARSNWKEKENEGIFRRPRYQEEDGETSPR